MSQLVYWLTHLLTHNYLPGSMFQPCKMNIDHCSDSKICKKLSIDSIDFQKQYEYKCKWANE